jgi:hypothetical protein
MTVPVLYPAGPLQWGDEMPIKVANALYWAANCLAILCLAGFTYVAMQPKAFNPFGMIAVGVGLACIFWLAGKTCKYMPTARQLVTKVTCAGCGHAGAITWNTEGETRKFADSSCFHQRPGQAVVLCNHCDAALPV